MRKCNESILSSREICPHSQPWIVGLSVFKMGAYRCGGTLISKRHVLTAAHCSMGWNVNKFSPYKFSSRWRWFIFMGYLGIKHRWVGLGDHDTKKNEGGEAFIAILNFITHPKWHDMAANMRPDEKWEYDVAIAVLEQPVQYGQHIQPACLPPINYKVDYDHTPVAVTGWGFTTWGNRYPNGTKKYNTKASKLRSVKLIALPSTVCHTLDTIFQVSTSHSNFDSVMCARPIKDKGNSVDSCKGDSGGKISIT